MYRCSLSDSTELIVLQRWHASELFDVVAGCREHLREWLPWVDDTQSAADSERFIVDALAQLASNRSFQAGIFHHNRIVGVVGYHPIDWRNRKTALGYWLAPEHQGQGLMTRSCRELITHGFRELGLTRIEIRCAVHNRRSRSIPERLGFKQEGVARRAEWLYDHYVDLVVYAMLASDWEAPAAPG